MANTATEAVIAQLRKQRPRKDDAGTYDVAMSGTDIMSRVRYTLMTGIPAFDDVTGGVPFGRVTEIYGLESCGKSALVQLLAAQAQTGQIWDKDRSAPVVDAKTTVLYIDNEQSLDSGERAVINGVALDIILARCDTVDDLFKMVDITISEVAKVEATTGVTQFVLVVVDTIAGTSSKEEMVQDWGKEDFNRQAKFMSKGFRRMRLGISRHNVAMVCVNQVRDSFKAKTMAGKFATGPQDEDFTTFGGRALKFYSSLRVFMHVVSKNYQLAKGASRFSQGLLIHFVTTKNRVKMPLRAGRLVLLFSSGLSPVLSTLETLIYYRVAEIKKDGTMAVQIHAKQCGIDVSEFELRPRQQNPELRSKAEWPAFAANHTSAAQTLWKRVLDIAFSDAGKIEADEDEDDDESFNNPLNDN